jgi:hypothetical protein
MTYQKTLNLITEVFSEYKDLTLHDIGEITYELTSDCYRFKPVDIETFIKDKYFLGESIGDTIYPFWMDFLKEKIYPHPCLNMYNEVILSTSIGTGKSTVAIISMLYEMYKILCLKNPYEFYKISNSIDKFAFSLMAPTHSQGTSVAFNKFLGMINTSPFFKDIKATPKSRSSVSEEGVTIADMIVIHTGSNMNHLLGKLNHSGLMDEVSFFQGRDVVERLKDLHTGFLARRKSRFIHLGEFIPGILWLVSSPKDEEDYLNQAIEKVKTVKFATYFENISLWEVKGKENGGYLGDTFKVYLGDEKTDPFVIQDDAVITTLRNENHVIDVPEEHRREFEDNIIRAIRDVAGRRVQADISLFKSKQQLVNLFVNPNRFIRDTISMSFNDAEDKLINYLVNLDYFKRPIHPDCNRFIHLDIATKKDRFGLSAVYSNTEDYVIDSPNPENLTMKKIVKKDRVYYVDFAVGIEAVKGEEINIFKVMDFVFTLKKLGYPIKMITTDMYQGDTVRQYLRLNSVEAKYLSVDKTKEPYYTLKDLVNTSRIIGVRNDLLIKELVGLRDLEKKIDHLSTGSKDIADSVVGGIWACMNSKSYISGARVYQEIIDKKMDNSFLGNIVRESGTPDSVMNNDIDKRLGF